MSQKTMSDGQSFGVAGQLADVGHNDIVTYRNPNQIIPFGRGVDNLAATPGTAKLPVATPGDLLGVAVRDLNAGGVAGKEQYPVGSPMSVIKKGRIVVVTELEVTEDDSVFIRYDGKSQVQTITLDIDLETSNDIDLKIDGVSMTQVPYNASHNQTMTDIATQILADFSQIATCTAAARVLTLTAAVHATDFVISDWLVTGGSNQAVAVIAESIASISDLDRGKFRNDADTSTARAVTNARFMNTSDSNLVRLDLTIT